MLKLFVNKVNLQPQRIVNLLLVYLVTLNVTKTYRKPTLSGVYIKFKSFLPSVYKFGMV